VKLSLFIKYIYKIIERKTGSNEIKILLTVFMVINFNDISEKIIHKNPSIKT